MTELENALEELIRVTTHAYQLAEVTRNAVWNDQPREAQRFADELRLLPRQINRALDRLDSALPGSRRE